MKAPILISDYLDGTNNSKDSKFAVNVLYAAFRRIAEKAELINATDDQLEIPPDLRDVFQHPNIYGHQEMENTIRCFCRCYSHYKKQGSKSNYIFSKNLLDALASTNLDIKNEMLPKKFNGYFHFNGYKTIEQFQYFADKPDQARLEVTTQGIYIDIVWPRITLMTICSVAGSEYPEEAAGFFPQYFSYILEEGKTLEESVTELDLSRGDLTQIHSNTKIALAALIYITMGCEELTSSVMAFPRSEKKAQRMLRHHTTKSFFTVGQFFTLPPIYSDKVIIRKGHFGFRWSGPQKKFLKLTWINQSKPYVMGNNG